jgi:hypothetical protein
MLVQSGTGLKTTPESQSPEPLEVLQAPALVPLLSVVIPPCKGSFASTALMTYLCNPSVYFGIENFLFLWTCSSSYLWQAMFYFSLLFI